MHWYLLSTNCNKYTSFKFQGDNIWGDIVLSTVVVNVDANLTASGA